jgi:phosphate transport system substrate-binding protein
MKRVILWSLMVAALLYSAVAGAEEFLNGAGASFPAPVYQAWAYDYNKATGIKVNYQSIGSGGGQRQIMERTVDFGASDEPLKPDKLSAEKLLQFPTLVGGVVPVVNIQGVKEGELKMDSETLCKIYLGDIKFWDEPLIRNINPTAKLPHNEITVVHRSDGSGTTAIFTGYLSETCPAFKKRVGEGKAVEWPAGIGGKGNEGVANYVKHAANSIGYVEFAYAKQNKLAYTQMKNRAASGDFDPKKDFYVWLNNTPGKAAWPIAGATFILLAKDKKEATMKTVKFFDWAFKNGDGRAKDLTYVPLPKTLKDKIREYWKANGIY